MFYEGSLQSGIALAIQEKKLVGIFIHDGSPECATWQDEWLKSGWLENLLANVAVVLRIEAGSTEAGFLGAFCNIDTVPTFVVIQDGQLKEQVSGGIAKKEFINRIRSILGAPPIPGTAQSAARQQANVEVPPTRTPPPDHAQQAAAMPASMARPPPALVTQSSAQRHPPSAVSKGKQKEPAADNTAGTTAAQKAQQEARDALRKKKQEDKEHLARVQARIEADKAERKAQAEARKAERQQQGEVSASATIPRTTSSSRGSLAKDVNLNIRLFDGQTIRSKFPRSAKLQDDVRPWVDREFATRAESASERLTPYFFKQIQAPLPSRELSAGDEAETLGDIDLAPSATLVLQPVRGFSEAYAGGSGGVIHEVAGAAMGVVGSAFNLAGSALGYVGSTVSSVLGSGPNPQVADRRQSSVGRSPVESHSSERSQAGASTIRVRTLADQRAGETRDQQLYNGNQLNFEPRTNEPN